MPQITAVSRKVLDISKTNPVQIVAANRDRKHLIITSTNVLLLGGANVTVDNAFFVVANQLHIPAPACEAALYAMTFDTGLPGQPPVNADILEFVNA